MTPPAHQHPRHRLDWPVVLVLEDRYVLRHMIWEKDDPRSDVKVTGASFGLGKSAPRQWHVSANLLHPRHNGVVIESVRELPLAPGEALPLADDFYIAHAGSRDEQGTNQ